MLAFVRKTKYKVRLRWQGREFLVKAPPGRVTPQDPGLQYQIWLQRHRPGPEDLTRMNAAAGAFAQRMPVT